MKDKSTDDMVDLKERPESFIAQLSGDRVVVQTAVLRPDRV